MAIKKDNHVILTLDAGGTNFRFYAWQNKKEIAGPLMKSAVPESMEKTITLIKDGLKELTAQLTTKPSAISFGFPGPCDYKKGIVGKLPNFPGCTGDIPLGPYLEKEFGIPVFIRNDGNLFAYGEYLAGFLPEVNAMLGISGSVKRYDNLIGLTIGTGLGCGIVTKGVVLEGDNGSGGEIWCTQSCLHPGHCTEAYVGKLSLSGIFNDLAGRTDEALLDPVVIADMARSKDNPLRAPALKAFQVMGQAAGEAAANCLSVADGLVVIGGGLSGTYDVFITEFMAALNGSLLYRNGHKAGRLPYPCYDLENDGQRKLFSADHVHNIPIPGENGYCSTGPCMRSGVGLSRLGTSAAICRAAYEIAIQQIKAG
ncbi:MAG: ROK family protein [Spirochaetales bacterium]|nr:ROK family protein [Spirochaetales bacterium]